MGCVRHQGFIPWDDDIDISMLLKITIVFLKIAEKLPKPYQLLHSTICEETSCQAVVCNGKYISTDEERMMYFHGSPYVVGIDIFPLDYVPRAKEASMLLRDVCNINLDRRKLMLPQMYRLLDRVGQLYGKDESDELKIYGDAQLLKRGFRLKKEWFREMVKLPFECMELDVPIGYYEVLQEEYGDWRIPIKNAASHEYGAWRKQEKILEEYLPKYREKCSVR